MKTILNIILVTFLIAISNSGCILNDTQKYIEDLKSENIMVKINAMYYLGKEKEKRAVPVLMILLSDDQPKELKLSSINALGEIGESIAVDALIRMLNERDSDIKMAACNALGMIRDPKAVKHLIRILDDKDIRLTAIWALGNIGDKGAVPLLTRLLYDNDKYVRYNASRSLQRIGNRE